MARIIPLTGTEANRQTAAGSVSANEIHSTSDQKRLFLQNTLIAPVWHGIVADQTARLALDTSSTRGCWPGDECYQSDTGIVYRCISNNGAATGDWFAYPQPAAQTVPLVLSDHYVDAGNVGTSETDLYADTVAANQLSVNGQKLEAEYGGNFAASGTATRQLRVYFGGTPFFDTGALSLSVSSEWALRVVMIRASATAVRYLVSLTTEGAALSAYTSAGEITGLILSSANILKLTATAAGVGAASNDIVAKIGTVMWKPQA